MGSAPARTNSITTKRAPMQESPKMSERAPMIPTILLIALGFIVAVLYTAVRRMSVELTSSKKRFLA